MLDRLHLINFRRHADTELTFSSDAQIIAITGANGTGKSTLLEALVYATYGESRYGHRNLSHLVRRGAEHEGMQVELDFTIGDVEYAIVRRYERGKTSATLMANGNIIMQSADGVTAEVTKIFGMDAVGFRLAVIAQQFDVEGLSDMRPAKRRATVTRLLRQDALTRARGAASDEKNRQLDVVKALGTGPDMDELAEDLHAVLAEVAETGAAAAESAAALVAIDLELAGTSQTRTQWQSALVAEAREDATVTAAQAEVDRLDAELRSIGVPDAPALQEVPLAKTVAELSEVNIAVAKGEAGAELARTAEQTRAELVSVAAGLVRVEEVLQGDSPALVAMALSGAVSRVSQAEADVATARGAVHAAAAQRAEPAGELAALRSRKKRAAALGDVCDACEQPISNEHRERQHQQHAARDAALVAQLADLAAADVKLAGAVVSAEAVLSGLRAERDRLAARRGVVEAGVATRKDLTRRHETYTAQLARICVPVVDLDGLYARKGMLEVAKAAAEQYEQVLAVRAGALERIGRVEISLAGARGRVAVATAARTAAAPAPDLVLAHARLTELEGRRADEQEMVTAVQLELVRATEQHTTIVKLIAAAEVQHLRLREVRGGADRAAKAARLLEVTADRMATQIRPALQGAISEALNKLSEGRFTAVEVSDTYEITVLDDGKFQPLTDFSGGERVLVALATRLALAQVVAGRHALGGIGVLVLDEVFGSQDAERRDAILSGLRALRADYGQILLISHVGGLEEAADHVIDVSLRLEDGQRVAEVAAS